MSKSIDLQHILEIIQGQLLELMNIPENYDKYVDYKIVLSQEQQFMKLKDKDPKAIYMVVKFSSASVLFGQTVLPISITVLSEQNKLDIAQQLLIDYVQEFNLRRDNNEGIQQVYESPTSVGNFNAVYEGFRSVLRASGAFILSPNANYFELVYRDAKSITGSMTSAATAPFDADKTYYMLKGYTESSNGSWYLQSSTGNSVDIYNLDKKIDCFVFSETKENYTMTQTAPNEIAVKYIEVYELVNNPVESELNNYSVFTEGDEYYFGIIQEETVPQVTASFGLVTNPDTQVFYNSHDFTQSIITMGSFTVQLSSFLFSDRPMSQKLMGIICDDDYEKACVNTPFMFELKFRDGRKRVKPYRLINLGVTEELGQLPSLNVTFSE